MIVLSSAPRGMLSGNEDLLPPSDIMTQDETGHVMIQISSYTAVNLRGGENNEEGNIESSPKGDVISSQTGGCALDRGVNKFQEAIENHQKIFKER